MQKLLEGLHHFQTRIFASHQDLFERLAREQAPETLFITCSDSRISPNLITQTQPGELFILRNVGNLVPPCDSGDGMAAGIEFAVDRLRVRDIIICGHSNCGAMAAISSCQCLDHLPHRLLGRIGLAALRDALPRGDLSVQLGVFGLGPRQCLLYAQQLGAGVVELTAGLGLLDDPRHDGLGRPRRPCGALCHGYSHFGIDSRL